MKALYTGVHITFLVSYSGEYQEMVFGTHPTRTIWSYETYETQFPQYTTS